MSAASKTEKPTQKKLKDAARKGQTFKARDLSTTCLMAVGMLFLAQDGDLLEVMQVYKGALDNGFNLPIGEYLSSLGALLLRTIAPIVLVCFLAAALPTLLQTGLRLATEAFHLNLNAVNPLNGFKRLFSLRTVKDTVKALLYLCCFGVALAVLWFQERDLLFGQLHSRIDHVFPIWGSLLRTLVLTFLGCVLIIVVIDALSEYLLFMRDQKMDPDAVKRERKEQNGSPEIKQRRQDLRMELLSEQVKSDIRNSNVVVANPTHIAVGIYFRPELSVIPFISVMETNQRALAVRLYAKKVGVPVVNDIALARRLFKTHRRYSLVQLDEFEAVLRLLAWLAEVEAAGQ
ncbi:MULTISPECIES: EscU/YscU/HrcU family type III secretion system export apparatus switch protein [Pseudomonas]|uniref:EscU/YscU/HrcU family type III secretion system export apparatus switch protein n=1 Tax=Pseudomonas quercus TaxID=2722792 RepID=A0ABX0Y8A9_9PSED|nr:EscU/YscU/HrcU family type III secretion system export apparatus switch protein [Pseudomonas sp. LY10J]MBF7141013.1 EscU/YscU/HrcU family type III secretion system export apparatus switch protein [Pseudomonas sp. LY10J]NJO99547.1 EscU/YscU/HrcU family type III secretion system export apparatus switch protein [Pseudomonas quercus]